MTHTPGPWTTYDCCIIAGDQILAIVTTRGAYGDNPEDAANTRLMAAAPRMLAALIAVSASPSSRAVWEGKVADAITKATGGKA